MRPSPLRPEPAPWPAPAPTLRVLQVCPGGGGYGPAGLAPHGSEASAAFGLCRALDAAGVRQQIVTPGPPRSPRRRRWGLHGEIHRVAPPAWSRRLVGLAAAPLMDELAARSDLVHLHLAGASTLATALWAARRQGLATLVDLPPGRPEGHGEEGSAPRVSVLELRLLAHADAVLCPDEGTRRGLAGRGLPEELLVPLPRSGAPTGDGGDGRPGADSVAPEILWGPVAGDLLGIYRRVRRRTASTGRGIAGGPLAEAAGESR